MIKVTTEHIHLLDYIIHVRDSIITRTIILYIHQQKVDDDIYCSVQHYVSQEGFHQDIWSYRDRSSCYIGLLTSTRQWLRDNDVAYLGAVNVTPIKRGVWNRHQW